MNVKRAYKFRFYPTPEQEQVLAQTFGCARFVYNYMLRVRTDAWLQRREKVGYHETSSLLTALKKDPEYAWLGEVSSVPIQQALRHLQSAFNNFFAKRAQYPSFKSKHGRQSATYAASAFKWDGKSLTLAKTKEPLNIRWSRTIPKAAKVTTCTVSKDPAGRYFVSLLCDDCVASKPAAQSKVGIDLGLTHFAVLSNGEKVAAPNVLRKYEKRLSLLQRRFSKKQKGSNNRTKARKKVARLHAKIADTRRDFLHKLSTKLISENQTIAVETLSVKNMQKNRCLSKAISDASWSEFLRQLEYKALWYGRELIGIDRWYPSSKRCNVCGHIESSMPLSKRHWTCPQCKTIHDRDTNAAINILAAGLAVTVCGESVRPTAL
jgi:putative transposase